MSGEWTSEEEVSLFQALRSRGFLEFFFDFEKLNFLSEKNLLKSLQRNHKPIGVSKNFQMLRIVSNENP